MCVHVCLCKISLLWSISAGIFQCSNIAFDLAIFKRVPINPQMQIMDPEDCCGALRSDCSFDGVKFKRIITVLGNENWDHSQAGFPLKCFRMPPESRGLWFHCSTVWVVNSYCSYYYPPKSTSLSQPLLVPLKLLQWSSKVACLISAPATTIKGCYSGPWACSWNCTVSVCFYSRDQSECLWK